MLPAPPKSLGRLGDVLISALASTQGLANPLGLTARRSVCVVLVDGLGSHNLTKAAGHARFLNSQTSAVASTWFPSTTSSSISSFATGKHPSDIGFLGYQVFNPKTKLAMNLLSGWKDFDEGEQFQSQRTVAEQAVSSGIETHAIAPSSYERSGFTGATMRGAKYHGHDAISERFQAAKRLLMDPVPKLLYLYIPELDQIAHGFGSNSLNWLNVLEDVDAQLSVFAKDLPKSTGSILTSDHGVIDIAKNSHIFLDDLLPTDIVDFVGGDTRAPFVYLNSKTDLAKVRVVLEDSLEDYAYITTPTQLVESGYWTSSSLGFDWTPDLVIIAKKEIAFYHRAFAKKKSLEMVAHHGALTANEMSIPLITFGF